MVERVLLTGGTGMVGRNIVERCDENEFDLIAPSSTEVNLSCESSVKSAMLKYKPDVVIHCAGLVGGIHANIANPVEFLVKNVDFARNIMMASYQFGVQKFINIASSCMYPRNAPNPLQPNMILGGELEPTNEGYALAKIYGTRLCEYISRQYGLNYKTIIPCNLYGKHDKFGEHNSHLIPAIIKKIHDAKVKGINEIEVWGTGTVKREFLYTADLAEFVFHALRRYEELDPVINVGFGKDYTVNHFYEVVAQVLEWPVSMKHDLTKPEGMKQKLVCSKYAFSKGWSPNTNLKDGIAETYNYFLRSLLNAN